MTEITREQLLKCNNVNRARILKDIALGLKKYKCIEEYAVITPENEKHIPNIY